MDPQAIAQAVREAMWRDDHVLHWLGINIRHWSRR